MAAPPPKQSAPGLSAEFQAAVGEVVSRFSARGDGQLKYPELICCMLHLWSDDISSMPKLNNELLKECQGTDVTDRDHGMKSYSVSCDGLTKWSLKRAQAGPNDLASLRQAIAISGYSPDFKLTGASGQKASIDTCLLQKLQALSPADRANPAKHYAFMQWCNACLHLRHIPSAEVQEALETLNKAPWTKQYWLNTVERFRLEDLLKTYPVMEGDKLSGAAKEAVISWFENFDVDRDNHLNLEEWYTANVAIMEQCSSPTMPDYKTVSTTPMSAVAFLEWIQKKRADGVARAFLRLGYSPDLKRSGPPLPRTLSEVMLAKCDALENGELWRKNEINMASDLKALVQSTTWKLPADVISRCSSFAKMDFVPAFALRDDPAPLQPADSVEKAFSLFRLAVEIFTSGPMKAAENPNLIRLDEAVSAFVTAHPKQFEAHLAKQVALLPGDPDAKSAAGLDYLFHQLVQTQQSTYLPRTFGAFEPTAAAVAFFALWKKRGNESLVKQLVSYVKKAGDPLLQLLASEGATPELIEWLKAFANDTALPDVMPEDAKLQSMSIAEIEQVLLKHFGYKEKIQINQRFASCGMIRPGEDVAKLIHDDAQTLKSLNIPGGRHGLASKMLALIVLAEYNRTAPSTPEGQARRDRNRELVRSELKFDPQTEEPPAAVAAVRVTICRTMGHHQDVFHPAGQMQSYYLAGDHVRGSCDIALHTEVSKEVMDKNLSARLNAQQPAAWEKQPHTVYCSDQLPYLIRVGCLFESRAVRYGVDPVKLWNLLKPLF